MDNSDRRVNVSDEQETTTAQDAFVPAGGCPTQRATTKYVDKELKRLTNRLAQNRVAVLVHLCVYAHNCDGHGVKDLVHVDYVAGGGKEVVPGSLPSVINAVRHLLKTLEAKQQ